MEQERIDEVLEDLGRRRRREEARYAARGPKPINGILAEVVQRRGYARVQSQRKLEVAWKETLREVVAAPTAAKLSRVGRIRRGVLEVWVANSTINQELTFYKASIIRGLRSRGIEDAIRDIRIRVGTVSGT
ncbi:MAG: DUF721 domain-containing protein [Pirellulales bacterium]